MKPLVFVCLLHVFPQCCSLEPSWTAYLNMMTASCTNVDAKKGMVPFLRKFTVCSCHQQRYLYFVSGDTETPIEASRESTKPCGLIAIPSRLIGVTTSPIEWHIQVYHQLYVNITFLKFALSFTHARCNQLHTPEVLEIWNKDSYGIAICGERSPFSWLWKNYYAVLTYSHVPDIKTGSIKLIYQVCEPGVNIRTAKTIVQPALVKNTTQLTLMLNNVGFAVVHRMRASYWIHILGDRMRALDLKLTSKTGSTRVFGIDIFEGLGSSDVHRHPDTDFLMNGEWIYFTTFQSYIQLECKIPHCEKVQFYYIWQHASDYSRVLVIEQEFKIRLRSMCPETINSLIYCVYGLRGLHGENIQMVFDEITFVGPDSWGNNVDTPQCLLAGVAVADSERIFLDKYQDMVMAGIQQLPKGLVVDATIPELTVCNDVTVMESKNGMTHIAQKPLLDSFVSISRSLYLIVYAYGGYIDLDKSDVQMTVSLTSCTGLTLGCYLMPATGFLEIDSVMFVGEKKLQVKKLHCPKGNMFYAHIDSNTVNGLVMEVIWCVGESNTMTIHVLTHLSDQSTALDSCLQLHVNPFSTHANAATCTVSVKEGIYDASLQKQTTLHTFYSLQCARYRQRSINGGVKSTVFVPDCVDFKSKITSPCNPVTTVPTSTLTYDTLRNGLSKSQTAKMCATYSITVNSNSTYLIHVSRPQSLTVLDTVTGYLSFGGLSYFVLNDEISRTVLNLTFSKNSAASCDQLDVRIAYQDITENGIVLLHWNLNFNSASQQIITV